MTAQLILPAQPTEGLQKLDVACHLAGVAELLALCFSGEVDDGWRSAVRELQVLSHVAPLLKLLLWFTPEQNILTNGFVWVEDGRVVGNVSTQPSETQNSTWMIANVAVHPECRRRGLARQMMNATLEYIRKQGGRAVILQVDDENLGAFDLYRQLGFAHLTTRRQWSRPSRSFVPALEPSRFDIRLRSDREWLEQLNLAELAHPYGLAWNRPLSLNEFKLNGWRRAQMFFNSEADEHWLATTEREQVAGSLVVLTGRPEGDRLILMAHPAFRGHVERALLVRGLRRLGARPWSTRIEHPADDVYVSDLLRDFGFNVTRTLRWMRLNLN